MKQPIATIDGQAQTPGIADRLIPITPRPSIVKVGSGAPFSDSVLQGIGVGPNASERTLAQ